MKNVAERIKAFNTPFLPDKVALKYKFMAESPYRFFRGTCHLFFEDLSQAHALPSSPPVWMCGDLHVENLGTYKSDNRLVYFDLNDFDEATLGPAHWELIRMLSSIFVVFNHLAIEEKKAFKWANLFLTTYYKTLQNEKALSIDPRTADGIVKKFLEKVSGRKQGLLLKKHARKTKNGFRLTIDQEKHYALEKPFKKELIQHMKAWLRQDENTPYNYQILDACFRVAGTGSVGVKRYLLLLESTQSSAGFVLLDMKQATPSSLTPYIQLPQPHWKNEAERTRCIQQRMQYMAPALLSTVELKGEWFVVQEMQPVEDKIDFLMIKKRYRSVCEAINAMALLTASGQLRSCSRQGSATADELIAFGHAKKDSEILINYANTYAQKVKTDFQVFVDHYKNGFFK